VRATYHRWRIGDGRSVSDVIRALEADGVVRTAQPNYRYRLAQSPPAAARPDVAVLYASEKLISPKRTGLALAKTLSSRASTPGSTRRILKSPMPWRIATTPFRPAHRICTGPEWPGRSSRGRG